MQEADPVQEGCVASHHCHGGSPVLHLPHASLHPERPEQSGESQGECVEDVEVLDGDNLVKSYADVCNN